jgi:restriction endonuclease Mrr
MQEADRLPSHAAMAWPTLIAIKRAGGSATNSEIMEAVAHDLQLSERQRAITRTRRGSRTLLDYRLAWSRTLLKNMGAITNDAPCTWSITEVGYQIKNEDVQAFVKNMLDNLQQYMEAKHAH